MGRGFFITFEGLDGSGKTTQLRRLCQNLESRGHKVVTLRQPGSTALGERIRTILLDSRAQQTLGAIDPAAELALMFADRAQAIAEVIEPALASGAIVLCDRYTDSSEAYQGGGRELGSAAVHAMQAAVCHNLQPDLTLLLLPPIEASLGRARRRNQRAQTARSQSVPRPDENRFETEGDEFFERVHAKFLEIAAREPSRVVLLEAEGSIESIADQIRSTVDQRLTRQATGHETRVEARA